MQFIQSNGLYDADFLKRNWPAMESYIDFSNSNLWIPADAFENANGSTTTMSSRGGVPVRIFPDGATHTVMYSVRRPRMWLDGLVTTRLWYTGVLDASANAYVAVSVTVDSENSTLSTPSYTVAARATPTATGTLMISRADEVSTDAHRRRAITQIHDLISVAVQRQGAHASDDYAENFELVGVELFYVEKKTRTIGINDIRAPKYLMKE